MYLCLSLGFISLERKEQGTLNIVKIRSDLYQCIMQTRGEISQQLEIQAEVTEIKEKTLHRWLPAVASLIITLCILLTSYLLTNYELNHEAKSAYQLINRLLQPFSISEEL